MADTVGKISSELLQKAPDSRDPIEIQREIHKSYEKEFVECMRRGRLVYTDAFYVVVITKKERLMENVLRNYFTYRVSCPTPEYDQAVYKIHKDDKIQFLWVLPSKDTCEMFIRHAGEIVPDERWLLYYILADNNGDLLKLSKQLNNEEVDSILVKA
jgi:hypothetical protein